MKSYNDSILHSMSNAVMTLDATGKIVTCNGAGLRIWESKEDALVGRPLTALLDDAGHWLAESISSAKASGETGFFPDAQLTLGGVSRSVNVSVMPLRAADDTKELGAMLIFEDISAEKRMKSTMSATDSQTQSPKQAQTEDLALPRIEKREARIQSPLFQRAFSPRS